MESRGSDRAAFDDSIQHAIESREKRQKRKRAEIKREQQEVCVLW